MPILFIALPKQPNNILACCVFVLKQLITFDDADISTLIDKRFPGGVRMPAVYTVRQAQNKSLAQINFELRQAMRTDQSQVEAVRLRQGFNSCAGIYSQASRQVDGTQSLCIARIPRHLRLNQHTSPRL